MELNGAAHYLQLDTPKATLIAPGKTKLASWFVNNKWDFEYKIFRTTLFMLESVDLNDFSDAKISMKISGTARAMMECLSLYPKDFSLSEAYELMEGLSTLRPKQVQELLEVCTSIKVKQLFLYFAERARHSWFKYIDQTKIDLGSGNRSLINSGVLVQKYSLVLPKELVK